MFLFTALIESQRTFTARYFRQQRLVPSVPRAGLAYCHISQQTRHCLYLRQLDGPSLMSSVKIRGRLRSCTTLQICRLSCPYFLARGLKHRVSALNKISFCTKLLVQNKC